MTPNSNVRKIHLANVPVISEPYSRVAIDIVSPVSPCSDRSHKYIFTMTDYATIFPEAIPLKNIDKLTIVKNLAEIFSRVGVSLEIFNDRGS